MITNVLSKWRKLNKCRQLRHLKKNLIKLKWFTVQVYGVNLNRQQMLFTLRSVFYCPIVIVFKI